MSVARSPPQQEPTSDTEFEMQSGADLAHSVSPNRPLEEEGELSDHQADIAPSEVDRVLSQEQSYRETIRGICSYLGWHQIPKFGSALSSAVDNLFSGSRSQLAGKISVNLVAYDWLCKKLEGLNF